MLADGHNGPLDGIIKSSLALKVLNHLLGRECIEDHADDTAGHRLIHLFNSEVEVLAEEVLLGGCITLRKDQIQADGLNRCCCSGHGHGSRLGLSHSLAAELWESSLVNGDARLIGLSGWFFFLLRCCLVAVVILLMIRSVVRSPLVWILLRLVVAVLLIVLPGPATRLAVVPVVATLMIVRLRAVVLALSRGLAGRRLSIVVRAAALVVIPVHARLVLVVLLLILIPAGATGGAHVSALLVPALIIVSSAI